MRTKASIAVENDFQRFEQIGIHGFPKRYLTEDAIKAYNKGYDNVSGMALDALPNMITQPNNGVPAYMALYTSPEVIRVLTAKKAAEEIYDVVQTGTWGSQIAQFPMLEYTGQTREYGDVSSDGVSDYNPTWMIRPAYTFQTVTIWGDRELAVQDFARINAAAEKRASAAENLKITHNNLWFFGVENTPITGILNDENLPASEAPAAGAGGGITWASKTAIEIYNDILTMFGRLATQSGGLVNGDGLREDAELVLVLSPEMSVQLARITEYGISVRQMIEGAFPNMRFVSAPQLNTTSGQMVMMIAPRVEGQRTGMLAYGELARAHGVIRGLSSFQEKMSGMSFGGILRQPFAVTSLIGV